MPDLLIHSPLAGGIRPLSAVQDPVFAQSMVGPGVALDPLAQGPVDAAAPLAGIVAVLHSHAFVVAQGERAVLVHLGIDTVQLDGAGFTALVSQGDRVALGDPIITWSPRAVRAGGRSPVVPVVALAAAAADLEILGEAEVAAGAPLLRWR